MTAAIRLKTVGRILGGAALFCLGLALGPLLLAAAAGLAAPSDETARWASATRLLAAYDEANPDRTIPYIAWGLAATECGYDFDRLFGSVTPTLAQDRQWTPFSGYFDLILWQGGPFKREVALRRIDLLTRQFDAFSLTFLDACLRETLFAGLCGREVRTALEQGGLASPHALPAAGPRFDQRREMETLCRYLDGLAARQGQPLAISRRLGSLRPAEPPAPHPSPR